MTSVDRVAATSPELEAAVARLLPQLTAERPPPSRAELAALVADPGVTLLVARHDGAIVGLAMVAVFPKLTGLASRLEDVVVDAAARGRGAGAALVTEALAVARERGARGMELTSGPWREAANRLYPRLGFRLRGTNVYSIDL
ncbi:MAG TPA: GNAT family N-acetyltransferase [Candidatus Dormibacteraeota bacterium]